MGGEKERKKKVDDNTRKHNISLELKIAFYLFSQKYRESF